MAIPDWPQWAPIALDMRPELHPAFQSLPAGISEFTFSNIFLFRRTYGYQVSRVGPGLYALSGAKNGRSFFALPWGLPDDATLKGLFSSFDFLKNYSEAQVEADGARLLALGFQPAEDRDNFDYLYDSGEMADLEGKKFHKKRNLIHQFHHHFVREFRRIGPEDTGALLEVLEIWQSRQEDKNDYIASREAIELRDQLQLDGALWFIEGKPVAYALGEAVQQGKSYVIHFEKADNQYKGIYQLVFNDYAQELRKKHELINREQDLGDPGLRQAKETYRPVGFVKKYQVAAVST